MRLRLICLSMLLTSLMVSSTGCLAVAVGAGAAGTVAYLAGDLESEEPYDIDTTYAATEKAMADLKLHVIEGESGHDALSATVVARDSADKRITVKLKSLTYRTTEISVRIGTFGSETKSRLIYNKIMENLRATAPPPAQARANAPASPPPPPSANPPASPEPAPMPPAPPSPPQPSQDAPNSPPPP